MNATANTTDTVATLGAPPLAGVRRRVAESRGRVALVGILSGYFALLAGLGGHSGWRVLGVPTMFPIFADMRSVTSAWECTRRGIPVMAVNPCDPWNRPANYPRVWTSLSFLGLGQGSTVALGLLAAAVFFVAAIAVLPSRAGVVDGIVYGLAVCSPAVMFGVERGNVDIVLFALTVLAVVMLQHRRGGTLWSPALVLLGSILKLFPIFAVGLVARRRGRATWLSWAAVAALFGIYALATLGDLRTIARVVPQQDSYSYGIDIVGRWLHGGLPAFSPRVYDVAIALTVVAGAILARHRLSARLSTDADDPAAVRDLDAFWAGACIYVCTYALFRSWDYRLVFLLLTIPQLLRWTRQRRPLAAVALASVFATLWLGNPPVAKPGIGWFFAHWNTLTAMGPFDRVLPFGVATQAVVFATLVVALVATVHSPARSEATG